MSMAITRHVIADFTLLGMALDMIGGLYLAYDLLGGKSGPLRTVTRIASYVALFLLGYSLVLGIRYAIIASLGMGILLAAEYWRVDSNPSKDRSVRWSVLLFGMLRGMVLGLAATTFAGIGFGVLFGLLSGLGLTVTYAFGFSPTVDYETNSKPGLSKHKFVASLLRAAAVAFAGLISAYAVLHGHNLFGVGLRLGVAAGLVSGLVGLFSPSVEWWIENVSDRRLGVIGLGLIFAGMLLQSIQYFAVVFDVNVR